MIASQSSLGLRQLNFGFPPKVLSYPSTTGCLKPLKQGLGAVLALPHKHEKHVFHAFRRYSRECRKAPSHDFLVHTLTRVRPRHCLHTMCEQKHNRVTLHTSFTQFFALSFGRHRNLNEGHAEWREVSAGIDLSLHAARQSPFRWVMQRQRQRREQSVMERVCLLLFLA